MDPLPPISIVRLQSFMKNCHYELRVGLVKLTGLMFEGCYQENEEEVLLLGGGHEPQGGEESQEALPCQCGEVEGGLSDEREIILSNSVSLFLGHSGE